ncbi:LOW QUALITY PROTEIN: conserved hypothetical protein, partial [Streptomyces himastatinicus ATCC 53653]
MFDPDIAPSGTLLGLLQRGRGDGTLHALAAPRAEALAALHHCVLHDPRRDWQVENRSLYYARLCLDLDADLDEIEQHLFHPDDLVNTDEERTGLALAVLGHLAAYDRLDALRLLRRYAASGSNWEWALDELALRDDDAGLRALAPVVLGRFPETPDGNAELAAAARGAYEPRPWRLWADDPTHGPRVRAVQEQGSFDRWQRQLRPSGPRPGWSVHDVLAWAQQEHDLRPGSPSPRRRRPLPRRRRRSGGPPRAAGRRRERAGRGPCDRPAVPRRHRRPRGAGPDRGRGHRAGRLGVGFPCRPKVPSNACAASPPSTAPGSGRTAPTRSAPRPPPCSPPAAGSTTRGSSSPPSAARCGPRARTASRCGRSSTGRAVSRSPAPPRCCATSTAKPPPPICAAAPPAPWPPPIPRSRRASRSNASGTARRPPANSPPTTPPPVTPASWNSSADWPPTRPRKPRSRPRSAAASAPTPRAS